MALTMALSSLIKWSCMAAVAKPAATTVTSDGLLNPHMTQKTRTCSNKEGLNRSRQSPPPFVSASLEDPETVRKNPATSRPSLRMSPPPSKSNPPSSVSLSRPYFGKNTRINSVKTGASLPPPPPRTKANVCNELAPLDEQSWVHCGDEETGIPHGDTTAAWYRITECWRRDQATGRSSLTANT